MCFYSLLTSVLPLFYHLLYHSFRPARGPNFTPTGISTVHSRECDALHRWQISTKTARCAKPPLPPPPPTPTLAAALPTKSGVICRRRSNKVGERLRSIRRKYERHGSEQVAGIVVCVLIIPAQHRFAVFLPPPKP